MKNSEFNAIVENLNEMINRCKNDLKEYNSNGREVANMKVKSINHIIACCRVHQSNMDKYIKTDLYHIIGMGKLSAAQSSKLIRLTKELMKYRSDVKFFAMMNTIKEPSRKSETVFELSSGIKLTR